MLQRPRAAASQEQGVGVHQGPLPARLPVRALSVRLPPGTLDLGQGLAGPARLSRTAPLCLGWCSRTCQVCVWGGAGGQGGGARCSTEHPAIVVMCVVVCVVVCVCVCVCGSGSRPCLHACTHMRLRTDVRPCCCTPAPAWPVPCRCFCASHQQQRCAGGACGGVRGGGQCGG